MHSDTVDCEAGIQCGQEDVSRQRNRHKIFTAIACIGFLGFFISTGGKVDTKSEIIIRKLLGEEDSETSNSPLFLQRIDNTNLLNKFMLKYGLEGASSADFYDGVETVDEKGWAYISIYSDSSCSGTEYSIGGVVTEQCFTYYSEDDDGAAATSIRFQCLDGEVILSQFGDNSCEDLTKSRRIIAEGCNQLNSTWNMDPNNLFYGNIQCSTGPEYPVYGDFNMFKGYIADTPETCDGLSMFEANPLNSCAPIYWQNKSHSIVFGVKDDDSTPYATFFTESADCTGVNVNMDLHTGCTGISLNADYANSSEVSYSWEYYTPAEVRTLHPSLAPTVGAVTLEPTVEPTLAPVEETTQPPTIAPSEEKTDNPTRSWVKTDNPTIAVMPITNNPTPASLPTTNNPTPASLPTTNNPTPGVYNPSSVPISYSPTPKNLNPVMQVKVEQDVVKIDPNVIVKT